MPIDGQPEGDRCFPSDPDRGLEDLGCRPRSSARDSTSWFPLCRKQLDTERCRSWDRPAAGSRYRAGVLDAHERFVASGPLRMWTERIGDPGRAAVLMVTGSAAHGVGCPDALLGRLVARGVAVILFDHRDTGRSSVVDFDAHPYTI